MKAASKTRLEHAQIGHLLTAVFTLCSLDASLTPHTLDRLVLTARLAAAKRIARLRPNRKVLVDLDVLGHVIYVWQRTAKYLDDDGHPIAIPARGPAPSIEALFREVDRIDYFRHGFAHLSRLNRIRRVGKRLFLPCSEVTIVDGLTPEMVNLLSLTINRLVSTVLFNTASKNPRSVRLVERVTSVPDLPVSQIPAFKLFAREQGGALIDTMNEWLESRRGDRKARSASAKNVTAGLHVFSFVEKNQG
jgi:hypothetical protein